MCRSRERFRNLGDGIAGGLMRVWIRAMLTASVMILALQTVSAQGGLEYRVLATSRTSTMERELNQAAETGYRFQTAMGGETALGGSEVVAVMSRGANTKSRFAYKLLATSSTSTMERELQMAAD